MKRAALGLVALAALSSAGCPSSAENPPQLWLFLEGGETDVLLIDHEPPPF